MQDQVRLERAGLPGVALTVRAREDDRGEDEEDADEGSLHPGSVSQAGASHCGRVTRLLLGGQRLDRHVSDLQRRTGDRLRRNANFLVVQVCRQQRV